MNWSAADGELVPPIAVTVTSTVPASSAGAKVMILVPFLLTVIPPAATVPKWTAVASTKFLPVMMTRIPPAP